MPIVVAVVIVVALIIVLYLVSGLVGWPVGGAGGWVDRRGWWVWLWMKFIALM